ncbi:NAD(P)/FAD-dependent oxidoreductase [Sphingomonas baiyangensis]|uniref:NAD(P)/FAD-dependent oxidoreductase n=1 Tax=Sphingomonas baiyangensis TaxID=2572576 RepID=UPI002015EABE|nr:FAD-dependent monooxygenase [Sphingomonas baiyangensis]
MAPLIVGGAPAGCAAAIALARLGHRATIIERDRETGDAICGGFLSWRTLDALAALGVASEQLRGAPVSSVRLVAAHGSGEAPLPRPAIGVSRRTLDTAMQRVAARAGVGFERGVAVRAIEGQTLRLADGGTVAAPAIFLANGKHDLRGAARDAARRADPTLGLRVRLAPHPALARMVGHAIELHLFAGGYAGLMLHEDGSANLCMAIRRSRLRAAGDPAALLAALAREVPPLADRLAHARGPIDAIANVPYGWRATGTQAGRFRLGDQAAVIPSLAGEGLGIAMASGTAAAAAYDRGGPGAAPACQAAFARDAAIPLRRAALLRDLAQHPLGARMMLGLMRLAPGAAGIAGRLTRIKHRPVDDGTRTQHI